MLARWIPEHWRRLLPLLPGQFPADPAADPTSSWLRLVRALAGVVPFDAITAIGNTGAAGTHTFTVAGDQTARFPVGLTTQCGASSLVPRARDGVNDGQYTVAAVALVGGATVVTVAEAIAQSAPAERGFLRGNDAHTLATRGFQEVEELLFRLRTHLRLPDATGRALEVFGEIVGLGRTSTDEDEYRADIRLQAAINHSAGRPEDIIAATAGLPGVTGVTLLEGAIARIFLHILGTLPAADTRARIRSMKGGGIAMDIIASGGSNPFVFGFDMDAAGVGADPPGEDPDGTGFGEAYPIIAVTVGGAGAGEFFVAGDATGALTAGDTMTVQGSTNNDGTYTIDAVVFEPGPVRTRLEVAEAVAAVADGDILDGGSGSGDFSDVF